MLRLLGLDMDGTFLNDEKKIQPSALDAVRRAVSEGKMVVLTTGRSINELLPYERELAGIVRYCVLESGGIVYDREERRVLRRVEIPLEISREVFRRTEGLGICPMVMSHGYSVMRPEFFTRLSEYHISAYQDLYDRYAGRDPDLERTYSYRDTAEKINLFSRTVSAREQLKDLLSDLPLVMTFSEITSLELSPMGVDKWTGLSYLLEMLDISKEETIAAGDAPNDLPILRNAGLSCAMGNASKEVQEMADVCVGSNNEDGIREIVDRFLLGNPEIF